MSLKIEQDRSRFQKIIKGKIKKELGKFISSGELIGKQGKKLVSIPIPRIDIPKFRFTDKQQGGVGQGEGNVGDPVGQGDGEGEEQGAGQAGDQEGQHVLEVDITFDEMVETDQVTLTEKYSDTKYEQNDVNPAFTRTFLHPPFTRGGGRLDPPP